MTDVAMMRVSSDEQRQRATIGMQREQIERYALKHDIHISDWYADDGVSGTIPIAQRPAGRRLIADARAGKVRRLFVYKLDRLGRDALVTLSAIDALDSCGVEIVSITQNLDLRTPHGKFMAVIDCGVSGYERDTTIERAVNGNERIARAGGWLGGLPPFGYRLSGAGSSAQLVPCELTIPGLRISEADVVREIYRLVVEERRTCQYIADWLNATGVPTVFAREGRPVGGAPARNVWALNRVRNLIVSAVYKGVQTYGKKSKRGGEVIEREVPPLVSPDTWQRAQQELINRRKFSNRNAKADYLFRGLIRCGECGATYSGQTRKIKTGEFIYYNCIGRTHARAQGREASKCASVKGADIEREVWARLEEWGMNPETYVERAWAMISAETDGLVTIDADLKREHKAIEGVRRERESVITLFSKGRITEGDLDKQLDRIIEEERRHEDEIARLRSLAATKDEHISGIERVTRLLGGLYLAIFDARTFEDKRSIVERCVKSITVHTIDGRAVTDVAYQLDDLDPQAIGTIGPIVTRGVARACYRSRLSPHPSRLTTRHACSSRITRPSLGPFAPFACRRITASRSAISEGLCSTG